MGFCLCWGVLKAEYWPCWGVLKAGYWPCWGALCKWGCSPPLGPLLGAQHLLGLRVGAADTVPTHAVLTPPLGHRCAGQRRHRPTPVGGRPARALLAGASEANPGQVLWSRTRQSGTQPPPHRLGPTLLSRSRSGAAPATLTEEHDPKASEKPAPAARVQSLGPVRLEAGCVTRRLPHHVGPLWEPPVALEGSPRAHTHQHLRTCRTEVHVWLQQATSSRAASGPDSG